MKSSKSEGMLTNTIQLDTAEYLNRKWLLWNDDSVAILIDKADMDEELRHKLIAYFRNIKSIDQVKELSQILPNRRIYDSTTNIGEFNIWYTQMVLLKLMFIKSLEEETCQS